MARRRRPGQSPTPRKVNGKWKCWYRVDIVEKDGTHRRRQKTRVLGSVKSMTFSEAKAVARRLVAPTNDLAPTFEYSERTVNDLIQKWRETVARTLRPETLRSYKWGLRRIEPRFGRVSVQAVERSDVELFLIDAMSEGLSYHATDTLKRRLKALFGIAVDWEWVTVSPVRGRFRLGTPRSVRPKTILSRVQIESLLLLLRPPYSVMVMLGVYAGLRKGEIGGLKWRDLKENLILISRSVVRGVEGPAKTAASEDSIRIGPKLIHALADWRNQARFSEPDDFLFSIRTPAPIQMDMVLQKVLKPAGRTIGVEPLGWHDLRHTFCTLGRKEGVLPEVMQRLMRHADIRTTLEIYSHVTDENAVRAIEGSMLLPEVVTQKKEVQSIQ